MTAPKLELSSIYICPNCCKPSAGADLVRAQDPTACICPQCMQHFQYTSAPPYAPEFTQQQLNLLLYLETCAVDGGKVDIRRMRPEEVEQVERWVANKLLQFGRVCLDSGGGHWIRLSPKVRVVIALERTIRAERFWASRTWQTTSELRTGKRVE